jgi:D-proline reductase (dithiol) PrdB
VSDDAEESVTGVGETFDEFRRSFSYGSRNNLNFKFMKSMSDADAADFLATVLLQLGDAYDTGDVTSMIDTAIEAQIAGYAPKQADMPPMFEFDNGPFTPASTPISEATIGLLTTSGHFLEDDDPEPEGMTQADAVDRISESLRETPILSEIPRTSDADSITVRHGGYDITSAEIDPNVSFPIDRLSELEQDGAIGELTSTYFSFPGATSQGRLKRELGGWIDRIKEENLDYMLLVPV